jgi:hypothetical protein
MTESEIVVFWKDARGIVSGERPGRLVQNSVSERGLAALAKKYHVFLLHYDETIEDIVVEKLPCVEAGG